jgi:replication factor C small subunit
MSQEVQVWTEKYRPKRLEDVIGQRHVTERLKAWVKTGNIPNMLFAGPAGVGKTTMALCLAKEIFGPTWKENFQETNASDERGIDIVRGRIKDFAMMKPLGSDFKIVFLDEADALTPEAQQALRRTVEKFAGVCRFILSVNYSSRVIDPIQSRCAVFRFQSLSKDNVREYLRRVVAGEGLSADTDALDAVFDLSEGDLRKSTNILQAASALGKITRDAVYEVASQAKPDDVIRTLNLALTGKFSESRKALLDMIFNQGLSGEDIIREIHRQALGLDLKDQDKARIIEAIGECEFRLNQGGSDDIQIGALLAKLGTFRLT